MNKAKRTRWVR